MACGLRFLLLLLLTVAGARAAEGEPELSGQGVRPGYPDAFAVAYQVLEGTISPDGRMAVIAADTHLLGSGVPGNFLVALRPFRILAALEGQTIVIPNQHQSLATAWASDNSAVAVVVTDVPRRADPTVESITLVQLREKSVVAQTDLLTSVAPKEGLLPEGEKPVCRMLPKGELLVTGRRFRKVWSLTQSKWISAR